VVSPTLLETYVSYGDATASIRMAYSCLVSPLTLVFAVGLTATAVAIPATVPVFFC
jgi:hypothetical protein